MISTPDFENRAKEMFDWLRTVPYEVSRQERLYSAEELYRGYKPSNDEVSDRESFAECYDSRVYKHFMNQGKIAMDVNESLARTLHDHGIHTALKSFLKEDRKSVV